MHNYSLHAALMLAYAAAFTLPALTANSLVLADLTAFTPNSHAALSLVLTCRKPGRYRSEARRRA